ncbi:hypothetical protein D3C72_2183010 [compost metagenome]
MVYFINFTGIKNIGLCDRFYFYRIAFLDVFQIISVDIDHHPHLLEIGYRKKWILICRNTLTDTDCFLNDIAVFGCYNFKGPLPLGAIHF